NIEKDIICEYKNLKYTIFPEDLFIIEKDLKPTHEQKNDDEIYGHFENKTIYFKIYKLIKITQPPSTVITEKHTNELLKKPFFIFSNNQSCYIENNFINVSVILYNDIDISKIKVALNKQPFTEFKYDKENHAIKIHLEN